MKTATLPTIASAITFIESEIEAIDRKRSRLASALDGLRMLSDAGEKATAKRNGPLKGTDALVAEAMNGHPATVKQLIRSVKVKDNAIRNSLSRLQADGRVRRVPNVYPPAFELVKG